MSLLYYLNAFNSSARATQAPRKSAGEKTKELIFEKALELFREQGFEVSMMRDLARAAGVATGAAYYYFPSKGSDCFRLLRSGSAMARGQSARRACWQRGIARPAGVRAALKYGSQGGTMTSTQAVTHWYPASAADKRPSAWWYWGRAVYVSRRDYWKITKVFLAVGVPLGAVGVLFRIPMAFWGAVALAEIGLLLLAYSLVGLYRMYGHPGVKYVRKLVALGEVQGKVTVADLHIGTYRHAFLLSDVLPEAQIKSVDCWNVEGESPEEAVADVRDLEVPPQSDPRIQTFEADYFSVPLPDASCDAVCFGFGTHELPTGGAREKLFGEATRILKPKGKVLLFEHGWDAHNYVIFGPVIHHVTKRQDWDKFLRERLDHVKYARSTQAVDLFAGTRR